MKINKTLHLGDCIEVMRMLDENSVDSIVTDPPYELGFMGKSWDSTGIAFNTEVWKEALRVLKPGGHLIAFSGSRTYHRMAVAIEDAGFEIRDQIMWIYGSGFPKSLDISKAIDKSAGAEREVVGERIVPDQRGGKINSEATTEFGVPTRNVPITVAATAAAKQWQGWGTALKPAHEPMVLARKPLIGTVAENILTHGTGGLNIDASRVAHLSEADRASATPQGKVTSNKMAGAAPDIDNAGRIEIERPDTLLGRFPANVIHDGSEEVVGLFPNTTSGKPSGKRGVSNYNVAYADVAVGSDLTGYGDSGSAARFFYCAKASKRDRNEGLDGFRKVRTGALNMTEKGSMLTGSGNERTTTRANHHPTVKPTDLMRYLCRLITPPNGTVLDPFMGSGSTGKACAFEGFDFVGIEREEDYFKIANARIEWAENYE